MQLDLLDEFRIRLVQLARQDALLDLQLSSKTSPNICAILNTLSSVVDVLNDWSDLPVSDSLPGSNVDRIRPIKSMNMYRLRLLLFRCSFSCSFTATKCRRRASNARRRW